jgi:hypothetical protein
LEAEGSFHVTDGRWWHVEHLVDEGKGKGKVKVKGKDA